MRVHGVLAKWNDDRGFGFIDAADGSGQLFVHISAFPRDSGRPQVGERVSFNIEQSNDGRKRAVRVLRPAPATEPIPSQLASLASRPIPRHMTSTRNAWLLPAALLGSIALALAVYAYVSRIVERSSMRLPAQDMAQDESEPAQKRARAPVPAAVTRDETQSVAPVTRTTLLGPRARPLSTQAFACGGRTMCSQMTSCADATWVLENCPSTRMDGDGDGVPCERQWCGR